MISLRSRKIVSDVLSCVDRVLVDFKDSEPAFRIRDRIKERLMHDAKENPTDELQRFFLSSNLHRFALVVVSSEAFDLVETGEYHLMDILTPAGNILRNIYFYCLKKALKDNYIDEDKYNQQTKEFDKMVVEVGKWA